MSELDYQHLLAVSLNVEFEKLRISAKAYYGNQFKNIIGRQWGKKPDLIIFHNLNINLPSNGKRILQSPIGMEFKIGTEFNQITTGVLDQIKGRYSQETYHLNNDKENNFKLGSLAFATTTSCSEGKVYTNNYPEASNFFIERFCWRAKVAVLFKNKEFYWSYRNYRFNLKGEPIGRYGKGGVFEAYD